MTLKEAIEIQLAELQDHHEAMEPDYLDAIKLLVEAGKEVLAHRNHCEPDFVLLLPGETED